MSIILSNAFSLQMLDLQTKSNIEIVPMELKEVQQVLKNGFVSAVGHQDTATVLTDMLKVDVEYNRINVNLNSNDVLIVAQITGGRLPEGTTSLPLGFTLKFVKIRIV